MSGHWLDKAAELLTSNLSDLDDLARLAGYDPAEFYLGTDLSNLLPTTLGRDARQSALKEDSHLDDNVTLEESDALIRSITDIMSDARGLIRLKIFERAADLAGEASTLADRLALVMPVERRLLKIEIIYVIIRASVAPRHVSAIYRHITELVDAYDGLFRATSNQLFTSMLRSFNRAVLTLCRRGRLPDAAAVVELLDNIDPPNGSEAQAIEFAEIGFRTRFHLAFSIGNFESSFLLAHDFNRSIDNFDVSPRARGRLIVMTSTLMGRSLLRMHNDEAWQFYENAIDTQAANIRTNGDLLLLTDLLTELVEGIPNLFDRSLVAQLFERTCNTIQARPALLSPSKAVRRRLARIAAALEVNLNYNFLQHQKN